MPKAYQMQNDTENKSKTREKSGKGSNLKGKKSGNNLALEGAKRATSEQLSNGWAKRRALIKAVTDWKNHAENTESTVIIMEDGSEQPISDHIVPLYELNKKAKKGNIQAIKAYYEITEVKKTENREVDENGKDKHSSILIQMIKRGVKLT